MDEGDMIHLCMIETWLVHACGRHDSCMHAAQEWTNRTPNATNMSITHFLLLPGSELSFTEITEYVYFSLI